MITGLHSCKPGNEPQVGQVKTFVVEQRTGKSGKPYTKIKSAQVDQGGQPYKITAAKPTGHTDSYGNVSFNLEIEATEAQAANTVHSVGGSNPPASHSRDTARQHLMRSANLMRLCMNAAKAVFENDYERELAISLFIDASRQGYIAEMDAKPMKSDRSAIDPELKPDRQDADSYGQHGEVDEPPPF